MSGVNVLVIWIPIIWVWYSRHREKRWNRTYKKSRWIRKKLRCSINDFQSECTFHTVSIYNRRGSKICMHWQKSGVLSLPCKRPFVLMDFPCGFHDSALVSPFFRLHAICWASVVKPYNLGPKNCEFPQINYLHIRLWSNIKLAKIRNKILV